MHAKLLFACFSSISVSVVAKHMLVLSQISGHLYYVVVAVVHIMWTKGKMDQFLPIETVVLFYELTSEIDTRFQKV